MQISIETARAKRRCQVCGNVIVKGENCLVLHIATGTAWDKKLNLCGPCLTVWYNEFNHQTKPGRGFEDFGRAALMENGDERKEGGVRNGAAGETARVGA